MKYLVLNVYLVFLRASGVVLSFFIIGAGVISFLSFPFRQFDYIPPAGIVLIFGILVLIGLLFSIGLLAIADIFQAIIDTADNSDRMVNQLDYLIRKEKP